MDILGLDSLFAEMLLGVGLAMVLGNGFAWWKHRRNETPNFEGAEFRPGRVIFLGSIGLFIAAWAAVTLLT
jgi:hypothetical protein